MDSSLSIMDRQTDTSSTSGEAVIGNRTLVSQLDNSMDSKLDSVEIDSSRRRQLGDGKVAHSQIDSLETDRSRNRQLGGGKAALPLEFEDAASRRSPIPTVTGGQATSSSRVCGGRRYATTCKNCPWNAACGPLSMGRDLTAGMVTCLNITYMAFQIPA